MAESKIPHQVVKRRDGKYAVVHPDHSDPMGIFWETPEGWRIELFSFNTGRWVPYGGVYPTRHEARTTILALHEAANT